MAQLNGITVTLMVILILFITSALICEFFGCDLLCSNQPVTQTKLKEEKSYKPVKHMSTKKLLSVSSEGLTRGFLLGGLMGGMANATTYSAALGVLNPFMVALLYYLPSGSLFKA